MQAHTVGSRSLGGFHPPRANLWLVVGLLLLNSSHVIGQTVPRHDKAGRGGFMRRFLTLVFMLCVAIPAGISISGCTRNPAGNYCNGLGYGLKDTEVASITLQPQTTGISLAFGQTMTVQQPNAVTCKGAGASVSSNQYTRSEERRVGKECRSRWSPYH